MSYYDEENKDGKFSTQLNKLVKKDPNYPEKTKINTFDIIGAVIGGIAGLIIIQVPFINIAIGAAAGYFLAPHFVPRLMRWLKKVFSNKN